jgi:hypothetical protein
MKGPGAVEVILAAQDGGEVVEADRGVVVVGAEMGLLHAEDALMQGKGALQVTLDSQDTGEAARPSSEDVACWLVGALGQALARHILHQQVVLVGIRAAVEDGHDVGMAQPGRRAGLAAEPFHEGSWGIGLG